MKRTVGICHQDFAKIRQENIFYVDKTKFIREWWEAKDEVTLITRPRRFGKTLNMSMFRHMIRKWFGHGADGGTCGPVCTGFQP